MIATQINMYLISTSLYRPRPCHNISLQSELTFWVILLTNRHTNYCYQKHNPPCPRGKWGKIEDCGKVYFNYCLCITVKQHCGHRISVILQISVNRKRYHVRQPWAIMKVLGYSYCPLKSKWQSEAQILPLFCDYIVWYRPIPLTWSHTQQDVSGSHKRIVVDSDAHVNTWYQLMPLLGGWLILQGHSLFTAKQIELIYDTHQTGTTLYRAILTHGPGGHLPGGPWTLGGPCQS